MRNLIVYFLLLTNCVFGDIEFIKPFPVVVEESISNFELDLNLNTSILGIYHTFKSSVLTKDNKYLIVLSSNNRQNKYKKSTKIIVYEVQSKKIVYIYQNEKENEAFTYLKVINNNLYTVNKKGLIRKWKIDTQNKQFFLKSLPLPFSDKKFKNLKNIWNNDKYIIVSYLENKNKEIMLSDINNTKMSYIDENILLKDYNISSLILDNLYIKDKYMISKNTYEEIILSSINNTGNTKLHTFANKSSKIESFSVSNDNKFLILTKEYTIEIYDIFTNELISIYQDNPVIESMVFTKDDRYLITATNTGYIHIWDLSKPKLHSVLRIHKDRVTSLDITDDGKYLVTGSEDKSIKLWDISDIDNIIKVKNYDTKKAIGLVFFDRRGVKYQQIYYPNGNLEKKMYFVDFNLSYKNNKQFTNYKFNNINFIKVDKEMKKFIEKIKGSQVEALDKTFNYLMCGKKNQKVDLVDRQNKKKVISLNRMKNQVAFVKISHDEKKFVSVDIYGNIYFQKLDKEVFQVLKSNDRGMWFTVDKLNDKILRGDNGTFLLKLNQNNFLKYKEIGESVVSSDINIIFPKSIIIENGKKSLINIEVENKNQKSISNIEFFVKSNDFSIFPNNSLLLNNTNSVTTSIVYTNFDSKKLDYNLTFFVKINGYELKNSYSIPIVVKKPLIGIEYITMNDDISDEKKVKVHFSNNGNMDGTDFHWNQGDKEIRSIKVSKDTIQKIINSENIEKNKLLSLDIFNPNPPYQIWNFKHKVIYKATLEIKFENFKDKKAVIVIKNEGIMDINNSEIYLLDVKGKKISSHSQDLRRGRTEVTFDLSKYTFTKVGDKVKFKICIKEKKLFWSKFDDCTITISPKPPKDLNMESFLLVVLLILVCVFILWRIFWFKGKEVELIIKDFEYIFKIAPLQLNKIIKRLRIIGDLDEVLEKLCIDREQIKYVINFIGNGFTTQNIEYFSSKLKVRIKSIDDKNKLYRLTLEEDFSLGLQSFYLYIKKESDILDLNVDTINQKLTIAISYSNKSEEEFQQIKANNLFINNKLIILSTEKLMRLLLAKDYVKGLEKVFVEHIEPKYISPFNTKVSQYRYRDREKENIIYNLNKKIRSHFIIGPKGSGKTYLLELIRKNLEEDNEIEIFHIEKRAYGSIMDYIQKKIKNYSENNKKQLVFLIDDIDSFIKDETTYKVLNYFKEVNTRKDICFIMAGFWELYQELNIKEKSPLQNFAVVEKITDILDSSTSETMIYDSMKILNIRIELPIIKKIISHSGGKVMLINLICQELLNTFTGQQITVLDLNEVLKRKNFLNEIKRLKNFDDKLEQIIVHVMADKEKFTLKDLAIELHEHGIEVTGQEREYHLQKLLLKDIFVERNKSFIFRIPMLQNMLQEESEKISTEIHEFNNFVPLVNKIKLNPNKLYTVPYLNLYKVYKQLETTRLIDFIVGELKIEKNSFKIVKDAFKHKNRFDKLIAQFSERLKSTYFKEKGVYFIKDLNHFPLNIKEFIIYFTSEKNYALIQNKFMHINTKVVFILNIESIEVQNDFFRKTLDKVNKFVAPKSDEITKLFLSPTPEFLLLEILSRHLSLRNISPYQITKGVENESIFFGREKNITDITQREARNYLIVGARRVGKSSLLKAIQRKNEENNTIESFYFTLSDTNLEGKIIEELKLKSKNINNIFELKNYLKQQNKKYLFLIDETDDFIEEDKNKNYKFLKVLREMSEEGYVSFILAGFWQLYKSRFEQQSPLLNFGDWVEIGALEEEACYDLITKPMSVMNIEFENREIVKRIIDSTGQKAQLISLVCQELLESKNKKNTISSSSILSQDVEIALNSTAMRDELGKWIELKDKRESNEKGEFLRQIIVYGMLKNDSFTTKEVLDFLREKEIEIDLKEVEYHLELLILSFFLKKSDSNKLSFRVPKQREFLLEDDVKFKIEENIYSFQRDNILK